jgi:chromosome segregation ATPase
MRRSAIFYPLALGAALTVIAPRADTGERAQSTVEDLRREVEQREQELGAAQIALTAARYRLALAEGKAELAAAECRTLLQRYEARLKAVQDLATEGRLCNGAPLRDAQGSVAVVKAWLAEAEGKRDDLVAELPKVIAYYEWQIKTCQSMREQRVISEEEAQEVVKESATELRRARERLANLRGDPAKQDKARNGGNPKSAEAR